MGLTSKQKIIIGASAGGLVLLVVILLIIRKKEHKIQIQDGITHTMTLPAGTTHAVVTQNGSTTITQTTTPTKHIITTPKKHKTTPTPSTTTPTFYTPPKSSTNGYLSDCNNAFVNTNSGGGDFESVNAACQNCASGSTYYQQNGYSLGGSCKGAPNTQDGNGYISDCNNYFVENPAAPMDHSTAQNACQKCQSQASIIQGDGYRLTAKCPKSNSSSNFNSNSNSNSNGMSTSEQAMINSSVSGGMAGVNQQEYFGF
jgi:hypothetical protein